MAQRDRATEIAEGYFPISSENGIQSFKNPVLFDQQICSLHLLICQRQSEVRLPHRWANLNGSLESFGGFPVLSQTEVFHTQSIMRFFLFRIQTIDSLNALMASADFFSLR